MNFERFQTMQARLHDRYGGAAILPRTTQEERPDDWPIWEPWEGGTVTVNHELSFIESRARDEWISGGLVLVTDLVGILMPHEDVTPELADTLIVDGTSYTILSLKPVRSDPDGPILHYEVQAR